ncbi:MAG: hypothetical protein HY072_05450 [Deltaproteobacteria bacterium]|nr:hypothetical protein [Deltaproteobacteria bacterium]
MIIEVPHSRNYTGSSAEDYTAREGGRIFKDLAARALLINGATRCAIADHSDCDGTTDQCGAAEEKNRRSDLSHEVQTLFQITHQKYNDRYASRVVQLHGKAEGEARAIVGDGTISDLRESSVAVLFAQALAASLGARVDACQDAGSPERPLCGETNVQARYTNNPTGNVCTTGTSSYTGRFLHIEQDRQLGDSPTWQSVSNGIKTTWPQSCDLPGADSDCTLGSAQSESQVLECAVTN